MKAMQETVLKLENVSKVYPGEPPFYALDHVNVQIRSGEIISIIGPSGSGKSTMLHLLGCLDKPSAGELYISGKKVSEMKDDELATIRGETIGFVFQAFNLAPTLTVFKNVELPLIIRGMEANERKKIVEESLKAVGLTDKTKSFPSQLSGGQKQRVAVARALATKPKILLADEPTGNLDSKSSDEVIAFILKLCNERGITVIFVTHDLRVASHTNRRIHILDGRIESDVITRKGGA